MYTSSMFILVVSCTLFFILKIVYKSKTVATIRRL